MRVLYVLSAMFPYGRAYSSRALNICRSINAAGIKVDVLADYISDSHMKTSKKTAVFEDFSIFLSSVHVAKERTVLDKFLAPLKSSKSLNEYLKHNKPDCIILSSSHDRFYKWIRIVKKHKIPIVLESCEWFDYYNFKYGKFNFRYHQFMSCWNHHFQKVDGVISISRLIQKHFTDLNIDTIRVPGLCSFLDCSQPKKPRDDKSIKMVFIGEIFRNKDDLSILIETISNASFSLPIELHVFGPTKVEIERQLGRKIPNSVIAHGYVDQRKINMLLSVMDYGIIIRPIRRSSNAGFPTKLVEYFSQGLPVIANLTGDIELYLKDGFNGFVIQNNIDSIKKTIEKIVANHAKSYFEMSKNAIETAKKSFNYQLYSCDLIKLIREVIKKSNNQAIE